jgi:hypothetical protein
LRSTPRSAVASFPLHTEAVRPSHQRHLAVVRCSDTLTAPFSTERVPVALQRLLHHVVDARDGYRRLVSIPRPAPPRPAPRCVVSYDQVLWQGDPLGAYAARWRCKCARFSIRQSGPWNAMLLSTIVQVPKANSRIENKPNHFDLCTLLSCDVVSHASLETRSLRGFKSKTDLRAN